MAAPQTPEGHPFQVPTALGWWPRPWLLLGRALAGGFLQDPAGPRAEERPATGSPGHQRCGAWDGGGMMGR